MLQESGGRSRPHIQPQQNQWTWERFCREEAKETASAFLEKVRRFKSRHATARDVHDSTFTNEFSAAFLEESSVLMAGENSIPSDPQPTANGVSRHHQQQTNKNSSGKSWWNGILKWSSRSRQRHSSAGSSSSNSSIPSRQNASGSTRRKKRNIRVLKETALVQLLNLNECEDRDEMNWSPCKLMLVEQQENYQVEIYCPPKNPMPKMSLFCLMIDEVRSTTPLEMPDSNSCFAIKSQNHGEYVFDVKTEALKQEWVKAIKERSNGGTPAISNGRLSRPSGATLPRVSPSRAANNNSPNNLTNNSLTILHPNSNAEVSRAAPPPSSSTTMDSSPLLVRQVHNTPPALPENNSTHSSGNSTHHSSSSNAFVGVVAESSNHRHYSMSDHHRNRSVTAATTARVVSGGDSAESVVMVDMASFMRNYSLSRSPNRQHKTMSMFVDPNLHVSLPNPYVQSYPLNNNNTLVTSPPPPPPPPPTTTTCAVPKSPSARFPYGSPHSSSPPPLPKRGSRGRSLYHPKPNHAPVGNGVVLNISSSDHNSSVNDDTRPVSNKTQPPPLFYNENAPFSSSPKNIRKTVTAENSTKNQDRCDLPRRDVVPRKDLSRETAALCVCNDQGSLHELPPSPGNLEACSQSSSTSALHPVSIAALAKQRRGSAPFSPTEKSCRKGPPEKERVRKISAPSILALELSDVGGSVRDCAGRLTPTANSLVNDGGRSVRDCAGRLTPTTNTGCTVMCPIMDDESTPDDCCQNKNSVSTAEANTEEAGSEAGSESGREGIELNLDASKGTIETEEKSTPRVLPLTSDQLSRRGFSKGEERSNHVTLTFPYFPQSSSPPQLQTTSSTSPRLGTNIDVTAERHGLPLASDSNSTNISEDTEEARHNIQMACGGATAMESPPPALIPATREGTASRGSNQTNLSNQSYSSTDDMSANLATSSNPIFVETTEGQGYNNRATSQHTHHPYEYWATNQQDITNMRTLSRYPWFHGMISRNNASQLVVGDGGDDAVDGTGQFLVRQSESREGDFVLSFNYHNRAKHLRMTVDNEGCNIQHLWFDSVPSMLDYFKTNSIPLETFWLNDDVKLTTYIGREASNAFRTTTVLNIDQLNRVPPRRSRSLHLHSIMNASSHPNTPSPLAIENRRGGDAASSSTNSLPQDHNVTSGWRQIFRSQRSSSAGNVGRIQRSHSHNAGSIQATGRGGGGGAQRSNHENSYVWRNY